MEIAGKPVPQIEHGGSEWEKAMLELDKIAIIKILRTKGEEVERLDNIAQTSIGECMKLTGERDKLIELLKSSATQVICIKCHTICTYDGKACTVCGGSKMIKPVRILDHEKVEAIIAAADHEDGICGEGCLICAEEGGGKG